ncbi:MAG: replication-associated recombination protein A [Bacteroidota bacterium]
MRVPLAERLRPKTLNDFVGQKHLVGKDAILRKAISSDNIPSMIFWGPPGVGKTTLARIIANQLSRPFFSLSAINSGVKEVREVIDYSTSKFSSKGSTLPISFGEDQCEVGTKFPILFIDEIHRFSKTQQDSLLGAVEKGNITLIGATTENPSFEIISALLSRCQIYILKPLEKNDLLFLLDKAIHSDEILKTKKIILKETEALLRLSGGDARKLFNAIELFVNSFSSDEIEITNEKLLQTVQQKMALYDKTGEYHYDIISAFIKSIRGSDPNAGIYWLARMIEGGEDPLFIARRLIILASEDISNANPMALVLANNCFQAVNVIGMPEAKIILAQLVTYLACSPKSNASYMAINSAQETVKQTGDLSVPLHIRNAPTKLMKEIGYGKEYKYAHDFDENFILQEYLPEEITGTKFFNPGDNNVEKKFSEFLKKLWKTKYNY